MMNEVCYWIFCFVPISTDPEVTTKIFGYSEFLTAVALFSVVYMVTDVRFKFRSALAPTSLYLKTFILIAIIGLVTPLTKVWIAEKWWVPKTVGLTPVICKTIFGLLCLVTFLTWMYYAFIRSPVFSRQNAFRFANELYRYILRGIDDELKTIGNELARSAKSLVQFSNKLPPPYSTNDKKSLEEKKIKIGVEHYALPQAFCFLLPIHLKAWIQVSHTYVSTRIYTRFLLWIQGNLNQCQWKCFKEKTRIFSGLMYFFGTQWIY